MMCKETPQEITTMYIINRQATEFYSFLFGFFFSSKRQIKYQRYQLSYAASAENRYPGVRILLYPLLFL